MSQVPAPLTPASTPQGGLKRKRGKRSSMGGTPSQQPNPKDAPVPSGTPSQHDTSASNQPASQNGSSSPILPKKKKQKPNKKSPASSPANSPLNASKKARSSLGPSRTPRPSNLSRQIPRSGSFWSNTDDMSIDSRDNSIFYDDAPTIVSIQGPSGNQFERVFDGEFPTMPAVTRAIQMLMTNSRIRIIPKQHH